MRFELRLQGGLKLFPIGMGWHDIIGEVGVARIREAPGFCHDPDCAECFTGQAKAIWSFWRMGDAARSHLLNRDSLCAPIKMTDATPGAGFIAIERNLDLTKQLSVDVCLSVIQTGDHGVSVFDDWNSIVSKAKDDLNTEVLLRLNLGAATLRDLDIDGFKSGKRLGTADIELEVRPSAIQFARDDD